MGIIATEYEATGTPPLVLSVVLWVIVAGTLGWLVLALMDCLGGQTPGKRSMWWREAVAAKFAWRNLPVCPPTWVLSHQHLCRWRTRTGTAVLGLVDSPLGATMPGVQLQR